MGMLGGLIGRVSQHVVEQREETVEALWSQMEHMFGSLGMGSDRTGVLHEKLQKRRSGVPGIGGGETRKSLQFAGTWYLQLKAMTTP